jgi:ribonuclease P protein component
MAIGTAMTPPNASEIGTKACSSDASAVFVCADETAHKPAKTPVETLKNRPDFLRCASARRQGTAGFMVQALARNDDRPLIRVGFTASKKIGNAVARNRAKRRLRALVRDLLPALWQEGWDYVIVAKPNATIERDFTALKSDLTTALAVLHRVRP